MELPRMRILCGILLLVATTACNKKAEGQTVAVVNNEEITASELNAEFAGLNLPRDVDKKQATTRALQGLIDRRLLATQAKADGLDRSPEFISRQRRATEQLLIGMLASRQMDVGKLPSATEIAAFQAQQPQAFAKREIWNLEQLQYQTPTDPAVQARIIKTKSLDEIASVLSDSGTPFQRGRNQLNTSLIPSEMYPKLASLSQGEPFVVPAAGRSIASAIVGRQPAPLIGPEARTEAVNLLRRRAGTQSLENRLKALRKEAKIEYKPGFAPAK
jgi:peptidyl-prolyl cis-trans isomerase C